MINSYQDYIKFPTASQLVQRAEWIQRLFIVSLIGLTGILAFYLVFFSVDPSIIAWLIFILGAVVIFYQPRYGLYLILFFTLTGDGLLMYWYPFTKNLSSSESLMYLNNAAIVSPLEIYIILTFLSWFGREVASHKIIFFKSQIFWPMVVFIFFMLLGFIYGISRGGDVNIGLWEVRPLFYLPAMLILANNLMTHRAQFSHLFWVIILAIFTESLVGTFVYFFILSRDLSLVDSITEHSAAVHINLVFIFLAAIWLYKGCSPTKRLLIILMLPTLLLTYMAAQRRAAFLTLFIALAFVVFILFQERRQIFWLIVPPTLVIGVVYMTVFWNSSGALGLPVQAVKSVVAQDQATQKDQSSNVYRQIENVNSHFNITQAPITGIGFGQKLTFIIPLPDISWFIWWEYIIHNSIIWIWVKTGIGGFVSMLTLIGFSIIIGVRALLRMPTGELKAIALTGTLFLIMHFIYAYVDMSWDNQSMILVGSVMGIISCLEHVVSKDIPIRKKRYPWLPNPQPAPKLIPLPIKVNES